MRTVEPCECVDVLVVGEGMAAVGAALSLRQAGRQVMLAGSDCAIAAEITIGRYGELPLVTSQVLNTMVRAVEAAGGRLEDWLDPAITELTVDTLLAGIEVRLGVTPVALVADGVLFAGKEGLFFITAGVIIDATAQGVLFRQSGVPFNDPTEVSALRTVTFEFAGAGELTDLPDACAGFRIQARCTWPDQVMLTLAGSAPRDGLEIPAALAYASRQAVPSLAQAAIAALPALADAVVAVTGHRMIPLDGSYLATSSPIHPVFPHVLGAGPWVNRMGWGNLDQLCRCGEETAAYAMTLPVVTRSGEVSLPSPTVVEAPVLVAGGGTGGPMAALASARQGVRTVLLEQGHNLGGIGTSGGIHTYYHGVRGGIQDEVDALTASIGAQLGAFRHMGGFSPEAKKIALERLLYEAGAIVTFRSLAFEVEMDGSRMAGVLAASHGGVTQYRTHAVVDATGDGDMAARAGAHFLFGRENDAVPNAFSLVPGTRERDQYLWLNVDGGLVDPTESRDLTRARSLGLSHLRREAPFTTHDRYTDISLLLGLRQSRQIVCDYMLTLNDQAQEQQFPDVVAYGCCHHDNHKLDFELESDDALFWVWGLGFWDRWMRHELPYRCLLPVGIEGLVLGCRALGVTPDAAMLFRMQRDIQRVGESAGTAAALAVQQGISPRQLDIVQLQAALQITGALREGPILDSAEEVNEEIGWVNHLYDEDQPVTLLPSLEEAQSRLAHPWGCILTWQLAHWGEEALPLLQALVQADNPHVRWWGAVALAMQGRQDGCAVLLHTLASRDDTNPIHPNFPQWHVAWKNHSMPYWVTAMAMLGFAKCHEAVGPLLAILADTSLNTNLHLTAIRALTRIGDPAAAPALRRFITRNDLPVTEKGSSHSRWLPIPIPHRVDWKLHLYTAMALQAMGKPQPDIIRPYLTDPEAYIRRFADMVLSTSVACNESQTIEDVKSTTT